MKNQQQMMSKYNELLIMIKHYCVNAEPITPQHITRAFKTSDNIFTIMMRKGYITQLTNGRKKVFQWNKDEITEALVHEFYTDVLNYQREYLQNKQAKKKIQELPQYEQSTIEFNKKKLEESLKVFEAPKKERRKITILWGLITF